jgi:hypothetical protein
MLNQERDTHTAITQGVQHGQEPGITWRPVQWFIGDLSRVKAFGPTWFKADQIPRIGVMPMGVDCWIVQVRIGAALIPMESPGHKGEKQYKSQPDARRLAANHL